MIGESPRLWWLPGTEATAGPEERMSLEVED
jgi:hypothetical protein